SCTLNVPACQLDTCAGDATCNAPQNTSCGNNSCAGGSAPFALCQPGGACSTGVTDCAGFTCAGALCNRACTVGSDVNCDASHYCVGGAMCAAKLPNGQTCAAADQCTSGQCVAAQSGRLCSAVASCPPCQVTNGAACVFATANSDPKNDCTANVA